MIALKRSLTNGIMTYFVFHFALSTFWSVMAMTMGEYQMFVHQIGYMRRANPNVCCARCKNMLFKDEYKNLTDRDISSHVFMTRSDYNLPFYHTGCLVKNNLLVQLFFFTRSNEANSILKSYCSYYLREIYSFLPFRELNEEVCQISNAFSKNCNYFSDVHTSIQYILTKDVLSKLIEYKNTLVVNNAEKTNFLITWLNEDIVLEFENHPIEYPDDLHFYDFLDFKLYLDFEFHLFLRLLKSLLYKECTAWYKEEIYSALVECPGFVSFGDAFSKWSILNLMYTDLDLNLNQQDFKKLIQKAMGHSDSTIALILCFQMQTYKIEYDSRFILDILKFFCTTENFKYKDFVCILSIFRFKKLFNSDYLKELIGYVAGINHTCQEYEVIQREIIQLWPTILETSVEDYTSVITSILDFKSCAPEDLDGYYRYSPRANQLSDMDFTVIFFFANISVLDYDGLRDILIAAQPYESDIWNFMLLYVLIPETNESINKDGLNVMRHLDNTYFMKFLIRPHSVERQSASFFICFLLHRNYFDFNEWINLITKIIALDNLVINYLIKTINKSSVTERYTRLEDVEKLYRLLRSKSYLCTIHQHSEYFKPIEESVTYLEEKLKFKNIQTYGYMTQMFEISLVSPGLYASKLLLRRENCLCYVMDCLQSYDITFKNREIMLGILKLQLDFDKDTDNNFIEDIYGCILNADASADGVLLIFQKFFDNIYHNESRNLMAHLLHRRILEYRPENKNELLKSRMFRMSFVDGFSFWKNLRFSSVEYHQLIWLAFSEVSQ